jgi:hypothetical protein
MKNTVCINIKVTSICGSTTGCWRNTIQVKYPQSSYYLLPGFFHPVIREFVHQGWLSLAVENTSVFFVGIVVLEVIIGVNTPPKVSIPKVSGVTSE